MFRITFLVDDKRLPLALYALTSIAVGAPEVVPVVNAVATKNGVHAKTNGSGTDLLIDYMIKTNMQEITGPQAKAACKELGINPLSYSHYIQTGIKQKRLKKVGAGKGNAVRYARVLLREA